MGTGGRARGESMGRKSKGKQRLREVREEPAEEEQELTAVVVEEGAAGPSAAAPPPEPAPAPTVAALPPAEEIEEVALADYAPAPPSAVVEAEEEEEEALDAEGREREFWRRVFLSCSLTPFPFAAWPFTASWFGWAIWYNGVMAHMSAGLGLKYSKEALLYDSLVNCALVLYVNVTTTRHVLMLIVTLTAGAAWAANGCWQRRTRSVAVHMLGVQWPLCFGLWVYEYGL